MKKKVLIVDDDPQFLLTLKNGLENYDERFSALIAEDGLIALDVLKGHTVSLVVTDLKMPRMDGFGLMAEIMQNYPEIPVIVVTGHGTPELEKLTREGGAIDCIGKPFKLTDLAEKIENALSKESEGGTLHGINSGMFLQLIEMEQKTCTIRLAEKASGKEGVLFFRDGELIDARTDALAGEGAAYKIFAWDRVSISIENACPRKERRIQRDLHAVLMEAMRLKDEAEDGGKAGIETKEETDRTLHREETDASDRIGQIKRKLDKEIGVSGLEDIYVDRKWDGFVVQAAQMGAFLGMGHLKLCHLDRGEPNDLILLPGKETTVLLVDTRGPKERIIELLSG